MRIPEQLESDVLITHAVYNNRKTVNVLLYLQSILLNELRKCYEFNRTISNYPGAHRNTDHILYKTLEFFRRRSAHIISDVEQLPPGTCRLPRKTRRLGPS